MNGRNRRGKFDHFSFRLGSLICRFRSRRSASSDLIITTPAPTAKSKPPRPPPLPSMPPPPPPPPQSTSKMDKYFSPTYDPLLDIAHTTVPSTGLLHEESSFENWNNMLEILRERKEEKKLKSIKDKAERKEQREVVREERKSRKEGKGVISPDLVLGGGSTGSGSGLMDMGSSYTKRGGTREWDMGK